MNGVSGGYDQDQQMAHALRGRLSRRRFLAALGLAAPSLVAGQACIEPFWLRTRSVNLGREGATSRVLHFSDLHYRGGRKRLERLVARINACSPELVCFTGDLIEERSREAEALDILSQIKAPLFGVPGNHDYWARRSFGPIAECFASTGGGWLLDQQKPMPNSRIVVTGCTCLNTARPIPAPEEGAKNILLIHYPSWIERVKTPFDLVLAGHSHGGQVRIPFYGPVMLPFGVDQYDLGLFTTPVGPLYVNPGVGWFGTWVRFNCRPELTVIKL